MRIAIGCDEAAFNLRTWMVHASLKHLLFENCAFDAGILTFLKKSGIVKKSTQPGR